MYTITPANPPAPDERPVSVRRLVAGLTAAVHATHLLIHIGDVA